MPVTCGLGRWMLGARDASMVRDFVEDLASRMVNRIQLTTDGLKVYLNAVDKAFGNDIDYAQLIKIYGIDPEGEKLTAPQSAPHAKAIQGRANLIRRTLTRHYVERQHENVDAPFYAPHEWHICTRRWMSSRRRSEYLSPPIATRE
jgi:hypothetical protein